MMSVDIMMSLIFRCRHHDESEHNDGRVSPLVNKGEPHFANMVPSMHVASHRPFPNIRFTWAYSCPSSLNNSSRLSSSASFFPRFLFFPPFPLFFGIFVASLLPCFVCVRNENENAREEELYIYFYIRSRRC
jgi:hypothetical protein